MSLSSAFAPSPRKRARIEIIPLIDVIFFLLATFVLFTLSLTKPAGPRVSLPAASSAEAREAAGAVTLTVAADGSLFWDHDPVPLDQFITRLQVLRQTTPDARVLINGDENALFAQVRYVIDEVRKAGIARILVETRLRVAD